jgi:hypothetical protein
MLVELERGDTDVMVDHELVHIVPIDAEVGLR